MSKHLSGNEIRSNFLKFFEERKHIIVPSSSLIPGNDPSLLFTNAGMVQFKEVFLGGEKRPYTRATTAQRCVRAGGKHNDLENVGYTARHHTFFEMLGNFSFGDYFKKDAIEYAWELLTEVFCIPKEKLWITVFHEDKEAETIWLKHIKVDPNRISRCGEEDNFWSMGDTGPCGPCTEIFYDHGESIPGGPPGTPEGDGPRYVEIWNLVFMQFNRDANGTLTPLPKPSVDTGSGLERLAAVLQGVHSNYDTDLFQPLIQEIAQRAALQNQDNPSLRVIADHIRSCTFLIHDGVTPSNESRGYVLRRIIRRAIRHGHKVGFREPFFFGLVDVLKQQMQEAYPELASTADRIKHTLFQEEQQFARTLDQGLKILEQEIRQLSGNIISGQAAFKLYDTYGFPADLTADIARERGLTLDWESFEKEMDKQRQQSQAASRFTQASVLETELNAETVFHGYDALKHETKVLAVFKGNAPTDLLKENEEGAVVLDATPFYAESGGQIGDRGLIYAAGMAFVVTDTRKQGAIYLHFGRLEKGEILPGMMCTASVDEKRRQDTRLNHSATHLLHAALKQIVGTHVIQKGSLVEPERLRFDFAHHEALTSQQIQEIEKLVNLQIRQNNLVQTDLMDLDEAKRSGAEALFGEKYSEKVRVLSMGAFSKELCGGTHVERTGDIGLFKIVSEGAIAAGIRRLEAVTGDYAVMWIQQMQEQQRQLATLLNAQTDELATRVNQLLLQRQALEKEGEKLRQKLATALIPELKAGAQNIGEFTCVISEVQGLDKASLRYLLEHLKNELRTGIIILTLVEGDQTFTVIGVTPDGLSKVGANEIVRELSQYIGAKGGGRPDMAQAGGGDPKRLAAALRDITLWLKTKVAG